MRYLRFECMAGQAARANLRIRIPRRLGAAANTGFAKAADSLLALFNLEPLMPSNAARPPLRKLMNSISGRLGAIIGLFVAAMVVLVAMQIWGSAQSALQRAQRPAAHRRRIDAIGDRRAV